nr:hypothetical protein CFP56_46418 [Quercus suber]
MVSLRSYIWWIGQRHFCCWGAIHFGEFACMIVEDYTLCITLGIAVIGIFLPTIKKVYFRALSCLYFKKN